jgi:predicted dehydrogenase
LPHEPDIHAPVRLALIGAGPGSFIGPIHRAAAQLDGELRLVAGVFSRDIDKSRGAGAAFGVAPERVYSDIDALIAGERGRPDAVQLLTIATPNLSHFPIARAALAAGLDVMSEKPATATLSEALRLRSMLRDSTSRYGLTYTYCGYPMIREARHLVRCGKLGRVRKVVVEYSQGWLARPVEREGNPQAAWRADPALAGAGGCSGDIAVHAFHLAEFVTGLAVTEMCADLGTVVAGRTLDDDCNALLRFDNGARGVLHATQIATGNRNDLQIRVWGDAGGLQWRQESPDRLELLWPEQPAQVLHAGSPYLSEPARRYSRLPPGHPEGFIEALANLYRDFASAIRGGTPLDATNVPGIEDGVRGLRFVEQAIAASRARAWMPIEEGRDER